MKRFRYKAKDDAGNVITGEVEANNIEHAAKLIHGRGLIIVSLSPTTTSPLAFIKGLTERASSSDVANFTRQLATMINAGLPLTEALLILRSQATGDMQAVVSQVLADVEEGKSLSQAMEKHPPVFSKTYVALIKSGEVGGVMDEVLVRLANDLEKQQEFRGKVKGALIYPIIVVVGMLIVGLIMLVFVIPRLTSIYEQFDVDLPFYTRALIATSDIMVKFWPLVIVVVGAAIWGFKVYKQTPKGREMVDNLVFKIPIVGDLQREVILTELTRTLSLMTGSGVSILEGLNITSSVVGNKVISDALEDSAKMVEKGFPVAFAFSKHPEAFPFILSQMIAVGEETGKIDEVLAKVSHVFEVESEQKVKALTSAVEPAILLVLGIGVAFLVISIILPIYNLSSEFSI
jgi:type IV pilus assembly protein PilC